MTGRAGAVAIVAVLVVNPAAAQQTFYCETTEGRAQARIVGGQEARIDQWPWQVLVIGTAPNGAKLTCGGSIIAPWWILTAAHCLVDDDRTNYTEHGLKYSVVYGEDRPLGRRGIAADLLIPHEAYDPATFANDIALIRLAENIPRGRRVQLSSERTDRVFARPGLCATITGWGTMAEDAGGSDTLQRADLPIVATPACNDAYPDQVTSHNICAGYALGGVDSCQGDSGGPLIVRHGDSARFVQVGIVSSGTGCARPGYPGIYTRVSKYIGWIQSHTGR